MTDEAVAHPIPALLLVRYLFPTDPRPCLHYPHLQPPVEDWGEFLGDTPAVTAMLDRLLEHGHVITCGPKSWD